MRTSRWRHSIVHLTLAGSLIGGGFVSAQPPTTRLTHTPSGQFLNRAFAALAARNLDEAWRQLDLAEEKAAVPAELERVKQLRKAREQLRLFFDAVRAGLTKYE